ncbi:uncharacterized protein LOC135687542 isoform X2 [Rhopilema esculentum]|uniref:uncharacterized protein LOC135687542 isoform X2 n=1 Tax=Rhopilema esculentum TaxID=499914 RepID=UPI0031D6401A
MSRSNSLPNFETHKTGALKSLKKFISRRNSFSANHMSSKKEPSELGVVRSKVISQTRKMSASDTEHSFATDGRRLYQKPRTFSTADTGHPLGIKNQRHDSGFSTSTASSVCTEDEPPELPPRGPRKSQSYLPSHKEDQVSIFSDCSEDGGAPPEITTDFAGQKSRSLQRQHRSPVVSRGGSLKDTRKPSLFDEYFFCEKCQSNCVHKPNRGSIKRRFSDKLKSNLRNEEESVVFTNEIAQGFLMDDSDRIYQEIDSDWLEDVRRLTSQMTSQIESGAQGLQTISKDEVDSSSLDGVKEYPDTEIYQKMNIYTRQYTPSLEKVHTILRENPDVTDAIVESNVTEEPEEVAGNAGNERVTALGKTLENCSSDKSISSDSFVSTYLQAAQSPVLSDRYHKRLDFSGFSEQYDTAL